MEAQLHNSSHFVLDMLFHEAWIQELGSSLVEIKDLEQVVAHDYAIQSKKKTFQYFILVLILCCISDHFVSLRNRLLTWGSRAPRGHCSGGLRPPCLPALVATRRQFSPLRCRLDGLLHRESPSDELARQNWPCMQRDKPSSLGAAHTWWRY